MTRANFVKLWIKQVQAGRLRNYPDITPAELAASAIEDQRKALLMWQRYRLHFKPLNEQQVLQALGVQQVTDKRTNKVIPIVREVSQ